MKQAGRVLVVAGSDSGGGAGIQADIKTVLALGGYATTAVTALTAQDTRGVHAVVDAPPEFVQQQMRLALADIGADAIKTGMLGSVVMVQAVADIIRDHPQLPFVLDPVMVAKGGHRLLVDGAVHAILELLLPLASVVTPNVPEAETLTGRAIFCADEAEAAAKALLDMGARAVLMKGGHLAGDAVTDSLVTQAGTMRLTAPRIETRHTHGTGCTLASAVATGLAHGMGLEEAVRQAHAYVQAAIAGAPGLGRGHGPLNHAVRWQGGALP